jgi:hypothetical protein
MGGDFVDGMKGGHKCVANHRESCRKGGTGNIWLPTANHQWNGFRLLFRVSRFRPDEHDRYAITTSSRFKHRHMQIESLSILSDVLWPGLDVLKRANAKTGFSPQKVGFSRFQLRSLSLNERSEGPHNRFTKSIPCQAISSNLSRTKIGARA